MRFTRMMLALGFVTGLSLVALAQQPGRGGFGFGGGFGGPGMLLANKGVQEELKLTDEQKEKIQGIGKSVREKYQDDFADLQNVPQEERREKMQGLMKKIGDETEKAYGEVLSKDQSKRLKQISLQQQGAMAFNSEDVQKTLKLSDEQKDKIKTINEDAQKEMRDAFPRPGAGGGGFDLEAFQKMQEKRKEMQKATMEKINSVLSSDQKVAFKEMTGAPFEVKFEFGAGRGGRGGRGKDKGKDKDN